MPDVVDVPIPHVEGIGEELLYVVQQYRTLTADQRAAVLATLKAFVPTSNAFEPAYPVQPNGGVA